MIIRDAIPTDIPELSALLDVLFSIEQDFQPNGESQMRDKRPLLQAPDRTSIKIAATMKAVSARSWSFRRPRVLHRRGWKIW